MFGYKIIKKKMFENMLSAQASLQAQCLRMDEKIRNLKDKHQKFIEETYIGQKVVHRSNEDDEFMIGECIGFKTFGQLGDNRIPIVKDHKHGKEWTCFGIIRLYSESLASKLKTMTPAEQWNYLAPRALYQRKVEIR